MRCGSASNPCCRHRLAVARRGPSRTGPAWPRSCSCAAPPPLGAAAGGRARLRVGDDLLEPVRGVGRRWGVRPAVELLLDELGAAGLLDWSRASVDSASGRAVRGTCAAPIRSTGPSAGASGTWRWSAPGWSCRCCWARPTGLTRSCSPRSWATSRWSPRHRWPALAARARPRRQGVRRGPRPRLPDPPGHQGAHRPQGRRATRSAWPPPLAGRAVDRVAVGCRRLRIRYERALGAVLRFGLLACCRLAFNRFTDQTTLRPQQPVLAW